jgi:Transcriptional regulator
MSDFEPSRCSTVRPVPSLARGLTLLQAFSVTRPILEMSEIVAPLNVPRSSVARLVQSLVKVGFLAANRNGGFTPGPATLRIGAAYLATLPAIDLVQPLLDTLLTDTGASAQLLVRDGTDAVVLAQALPKGLSAACAAIRVGTRLPLSGTLLAPLLLPCCEDAFADAPQISRVEPDAPNNARSVVSYRFPDRGATGRRHGATPDISRFSAFATPVRSDGRTAYALLGGLAHDSHVMADPVAVIHAIVSAAEQFEQALLDSALLVHPVG